MINLNSTNDIRKILTDMKTIAVVGFSPKKVRPSYKVGAYMANAGYEIIPVNPGQSQIMNLPCYPNLSAIDKGENIELVVIFRKSEDVPPIVEEAIKIGAKAIWMQEGIINNDAAILAKNAGLMVVMDRCIKKDHEILPPNL